MLCTSGFMDDVMFSDHGINGPESSTTICMEEVRQVAVSSWLSSSEYSTGMKSAIYEYLV